MRTNAKYVVGLLVVQIVALCGCSPQRALAHRLKGADRVIVMNPHDGVTMTVMDDRLRNIVQALEASKKIDSEGLTATPGYTLVFFKGGVHLATVPTGAGLIFFLDKTPCQDRSRTLETLYERFREEHPPRAP